MRKKIILIIFGFAFIVGGVTAAVVSESMARDGNDIRMFRSERRGNEMLMHADICKYSGYGSGVIGFALLLTGLIIKKTSHKAESQTNIS